MLIVWKIPKIVTISIVEYLVFRADAVCGGPLFD